MKTKNPDGQHAAFFVKVSWEFLPISLFLRTVRLSLIFPGGCPKGRSKVRRRVPDASSFSPDALDHVLSPISTYHRRFQTTNGASNAIIGRFLGKIGLEKRKLT